MKEKSQSSCFNFEHESIASSKLKQSIPDSIFKHYQAERSFTTNRPSLYPSPGKIPGSRKRRVNATNGPNSLSQATQETDRPGLKQITSISETKADYEQAYDELSNPVAIKFTNTSKDGPSGSSPCSEADPLSKTKLLDLIMTPPTLPKKTIAFGYAGSPGTPEITIFKNLSIRSPILSHSPGSSFSKYSHKKDGTPSTVGKLASPNFQLSQRKIGSPGCQTHLREMESPVFQSSPRQVPLKIISKSMPRAKNWQKITKLSPRFSGKQTAFKLSAKISVTEDSLQSTHKIDPPILELSSKVSPNESYTVRNDNRKTTEQKREQQWPISDSYQLQKKVTRPPLTPPHPNESDEISCTISKSSSEKSIQRGHPLNTSKVVGANGVRVGDETSILRHGFLSNRQNDERKNLHEKSPSRTPRSNQATNSVQRHDCITLSDDNSCTGKSVNQKVEIHDPPIKMVSLREGVGKMQNSKSPLSSKNKYVQFSLLKPGSDVSNEILHNMLYDTSLSDCNDTVGSLSDDEEIDSFFLTSPIRRFPKEKGSQDILPQDADVSTTMQAENIKKKTRVSPDEEDGWILNHKVVTAHECHGDQYKNHKEIFSSCESVSESYRELPKATKMRRQNAHFFSNMDVISETSVSNTSLIGMTSLTNESKALSRGIRSCSNISKSSSEDSSNLDCSNDLQRNQSDQSLNSLGLFLEGVPLCSDANSRDNMITPPIMRIESLTPPPIKKTRF